MNSAPKTEISLHPQACLSDSALEQLAVPDMGSGISIPSLRAVEEGVADSPMARGTAAVAPLLRNSRAN